MREACVWLLPRVHSPHPTHLVHVTTHTAQLPRCTASPLAARWSRSVGPSTAPAAHTFGATWTPPGSECHGRECQPGHVQGKGTSPGRSAARQCSGEQAEPQIAAQRLPVCSPTACLASLGVAGDGGNLCGSSSSPTLHPRQQCTSASPRSSLLTMGAAAAHHYHPLAYMQPCCPLCPAALPPGRT
jgi:hypothetical protein